ncbi:MAG: hypothetical protein V4808_02865 [Pseudomonadota bacterium]
MSKAPDPIRSRRRRRIAFAGITAAIILWQVVRTEWRIADLRARGFGDVVIESTRDHAYAPLIGAIIGALLCIGIGLAIKRALRRTED